MPRALLTLSVLADHYAICRLDPSTPVPTWGTSAPFWSVTRTEYELSLVCIERDLPSSVARQGGWRIIKAEGPLDFALTGIMASIAEPLADAGVAIFPLATYDTDHVLVNDSQLQAAVQALRTYGHVVNA
jgi:hypothetical protein